MWSIYSMSGFHSTVSVVSEGLADQSDEPLVDAVVFNLAVISGYIPLIGAVHGGYQIYSGFAEVRMNIPNRVCLVIRGALQCFGLGILFLIPDILVTIHRHCYQQDGYVLLDQTPTFTEALEHVKHRQRTVFKI